MDKSQNYVEWRKHFHIVESDHNSSSLQLGDFLKRGNVWGSSWVDEKKNMGCCCGGDQNDYTLHNSLNSTPLPHMGTFYSILNSTLIKLT